MFLIDGEGQLAYCNDAAELMLGRTFGELGTMTAGEFGAMLDLHDPRRLPAAAPGHPDGPGLPRSRVPAHKRLLATTLDGTTREVEVTAYPLFGKDEEMHGVLTVFWEAKS